MIDGPHRLEVVLHSLFQLLRHVVDLREVFEVPPLGLVFRPPGVDPLHDVCHVTEDGGVAQGSNHHDYNSKNFLILPMLSVLCVKLIYVQH